MKLRRIITSLLALSLLTAVPAADLCIKAYAEQETSVTEEKEEDTAIHISDVSDLQTLSENCRLDTWSDGISVVLDNNIDLEGEEFTPIVSFNGTFDGQGYEISGINITSASSYTGFFGTLNSSAVVKNVTFSGSVNPAGSASNVGAVAGRNFGSIENCTFTGLVSGSEAVGGIAGRNEASGMITASFANGSIIGQTMTGGICGNNIGTIFNCENRAQVNTINSDTGISLSDLNLSFSVDLTQISALGSGLTVSDTGGIAGYSCGNLLGCINYAAIGYEHVGYNVGGIAGRSCGYLLSCSNEGTIKGRKDIGGIIGQMEPNVVTSVTSSSLQNLRNQLDELNELMDQMQDDARNASSSVQNGINNMGNAVKNAASSVGSISTTISGGGSADVSGSAEGSASGSAGPEADASVSRTDDTISGSISTSLGTDTTAGGSAAGNITGNVNIVANTNLGGVVSAINSLANQISGIANDIGGQSEVIDNDLTKINEKLDEIYDSTFKTIDDLSVSDLIKDSSDVSMDSITFGKASLCENTGKVYGDINAGGIAGIMAEEYSVDPEDDLTNSIDVYEKKSYEVKAVIFKCVNKGTVNLKYSYGGGITGRADLGFLYKNENYGAVTSDDGEYIGGIAGLNTTNIQQCYAKNSLQGARYAGGISGSGIAENADDTSSTVKNCVSFVTINDAEELFGAVSGTEAGDYSDNYFVSDTLAGLDKLNKTGAAEPVTYEEMLQISGIPEEFEHMTITFMVNDEVYKTRSVDYGGTLSEKQIPEVPVQDDIYCRWDVSDFSDIRQDLVVNAVYSDYTANVSSQDKRSDGRNIFFVAGNFTEGSSMTAELLAKDSSSVKSSLPSGTIVLDVGESWKLSFDDDGLDEHIVRYLTPDQKTGMVRIYQNENGTYKEVESEVIGSYIAFNPSGSEVEFTAVKVLPWKYVLLALAGTAFAVILIILIFFRKKIAAKKKRILEEKEEQEKKQREAEEAALLEEQKQKEKQEALAKAAKDKAEARALKEAEMRQQNEELIRELEADPNLSPAYVAMMKRNLEMMLAQNSEISMLKDMLEVNKQEEEPEETAEEPQEGSPETPSADAEEKPVKKKKHGKITAIVIAVLLAGAAAGICYLVNPSLANTAVCAVYLKELADDSTLEMTMDVTASSNGKDTSFELGLAETKTDDGTSVLIASMGSLDWYYQDETIYLENGSAWSVSSLCPDYPEFTDLLYSVSKNAEISYYKENSYACYAFAAEGENARELAAYLYPQEDALQTDRIEVVVKAINRKVETITFEGNAVLNGSNISISAVCHVTPEGVRTAHTVPEEVQQAIVSGDQSAKAEITPEMISLLYSWSNTLSADPLKAEVSLSADCGLLKLNTAFTYNRTEESGKSITMNGMTVYFDDADNVKDANGNQADEELAELASSLDLIDLAHSLCMTTDVTSDENKDGSETYTFVLDDDTMEEAVSSIAPALEYSSVSLKDGTLVMTVSDDKITSLAFSFEGSVKALIAEADAQFGAFVRFRS